MVNLSQLLVWDHLAYHPLRPESCIVSYFCLYSWGVWIGYELEQYTARYCCLDDVEKMQIHHNTLSTVMREPLQTRTISFVTVEPSYE